MPHDEGEVRQYLKQITQKKMTPEEAHEHAVELAATALSQPSGKDDSLRLDMLNAAFEVYDQVPIYICNYCNLTYGVPQATKIGDGQYCHDCATKLANMVSSEDEARSLWETWFPQGTVISTTILRASDFTLVRITNGVVQRLEWPTAVIGKDGTEVSLQLREAYVSIDKKDENAVELTGFLLSSKLHLVLRLKQNPGIRE